ncbi:DUF4349 domain-containing protein [Caldisalinibacter kiritimatiensis]|uniref:Anti-sigma-W factor RsiW n=1 Tax=Caldisalinibacter kiritimatiensis TaxID=1304284 RepID=R1CT28_9FIRM|nr:DUF4349 domain-containing protein [Caldisalinibacter kiritimatiensis]EOC99853.1 hypothetical protein L21TH_2158 [Caldisalinibacter kiritimatiensis]
MDCKVFEDNMSLYIDNELNDIDKKEFELHLMTCEKCRKSYEAMVAILKEVRNEEQVELPDGYTEKLNEKLKKINEKEKKKVNWKPLTAIAASLLVLLVSISFIFNNFIFDKKVQYQYDSAVEEPEFDRSTSMNAKVEVQDDRNMTAKMDLDVETSSVAEDAKFTERANESVQNKSFSVSRSKPVQKIIKQAYLNIEVEDYDNKFNSIVNFVKQNEGYIENANTTYKPVKDSNKNKLKQGYLKVRIPESNFVKTIEYIKKLGEVTNEQESTRNISKQYYDKENELKNLRIQEERLREILKKAKNVDEILRVENELRRIRTEIDSHTNLLNTWDDQVNMSTININLIEVKKNDENINAVDDNIWLRAKKGFISTINNIIKTIENGIVYIITILPILAIVAITLGILYLIVKKVMIKR